MERTVLKAEKGKIYTNGVNFGKTVYLAEGADSSAWREISEEEYFAAVGGNEE